MSNYDLDTIRHSMAHVMAQALIKLYPEQHIKFGIGPTIEDGFYYDIDMEYKLVDEDLKKIEDKMLEIIKAKLPIVRKEVSREEAIKIFTDLKQDYKVELINDLPEDAVITTYTQGDFTDLCRGPHVENTGDLPRFIKIMHTAGAYWRGDSKRPMLQRIYATCFPEKQQLKDYLTLIEEAQKRDHRKLGKELELFFVSEYGPGFPIFLPKGMDLKNKLVDLWRREHKKAGYVEIQTPTMLNKELWLTSGHWLNYKENMYVTQIDDTEFAIKPMNCPGGILAYKNRIHSYKDLPERVGELGHVHRHELSGALHGLMRVRAFTQDDAHVFMTPDQIEQEIIAVIELIDKFYKQIFGFEYSIELSTMPAKAIGSREIWERAENALEAALKHTGREYKLNPGDGAFYGPKLDFKIKDAIGRTWQCGTIQLDFNLPERFDLSYIGEDGEKHRPVMIHRVVYGSIERFIGILIEHYAGAFPFWLAPEQVVIVPINNEKHLAHCEKLLEQLKGLGYRARIDDRNETMGQKTRQIQKAKIPFMIVIGDKEMEENTVNIRAYGAKFGKTKPLDTVLKVFAELNVEKLHEKSELEA